MKEKKKSFFSFLSRLFGKKKENTLGEKMWSGELVVLGHDEVRIKLGEEHPKNVEVAFVGEQTCIPCNPQHKDTCHWKIMHGVHHHDKHYYLAISWHVSDLRLIKWSVD